MFVVTEGSEVDDLIAEEHPKPEPQAESGFSLMKIFQTLSKFFGKKKNFQLKTEPKSVEDYRGLDIKRIQ